jgi:hypothetical protein
MAGDGVIPPEQVTALALEALETETNDRNRLLLYEMMTETGGEPALAALEQHLRAGNLAELDKTVGFLALHMEPARAQALVQDLLRAPDLTAANREALYRALGVIEGPEGADYLLGLARDEELDTEQRLASLKGLANRAVDERLASELQGVFEASDDPRVRSEVLRLLAYGETEAAGLDLRSIAALDDDPGVRAEALQLAAMQPGENTRAWLEQRLLEDSSLDVKAAALGALVFQAHYAGEGDAVLGYLERARKLTRDEGALAMIAEGERMVREHDPRRLELELAKEAEFWNKVAGHVDGPAARNFKLQARQLDRLVSALRTTRDASRPAR